MHRFYTMFGALALFFVVLASSSLTAQIKIGYTDPEALITSMAEYATVNQQMQTFYTTKQKELQQDAAALEQKLKEYQNQQAMLSAEGRTQRETELQSMQSTMQQKAADADTEFNQRQAQLMEPLLAKVQVAIDKIAAAQGLTIVLRAPALLFASETQTVNITPAVARELGIQMKAQ